MRVVVAPDSFGGWQTASQVAERMAQRLRRAGHTVDCRPMSDGGEGLLDALAHGGQLRERWVVDGTGPHGADRAGAMGRLDDGTVVVESSVWLRALHTRDPWGASALGLGRVLADQLGQPTIIGLGGSSTVDLGLGLLAALGIHAVDQHGRRVPPIPAELYRVARFEGTAVDAASWEVWADVTTPVTRGALGFGPQKGVDPNLLAGLQAGWVRAAAALQDWCRRSGRSSPPLHLAGGGAAGGLGFALAAIGATVVPGVSAMAARVLHDLDTDLLVTGEGRLDATSADDKVVQWLSTHCADKGIRFAAIVGQRAKGAPALAGPVFVADQSTDRDIALSAAVDALLAHMSMRPISASRS